MRIDLHIDRLVIDGAAGGSELALHDALTRELSTAIGSDPASFAGARDAAIASLRAPDLRPVSVPGVDGTARAVAQAIAGGLPR
jgi:hypothetical protein